MERRGINLGRCWNKYLIIDIFFYAAEEHARMEAEAVLWLCSRRHRQFLPLNFDWYPRNIDWNTAWKILKEQSAQLESIEQSMFLFYHIRIDGWNVRKVTRIYTASIDGWSARDFHRHCDGRGPTLCLIRSSENYLAAGFTSISWSSEDEDVEDSSAMVFALTNELQVFKPNIPKLAVRHRIAYGPCF